MNGSAFRRVYGVKNKIERFLLKSSDTSFDSESEEMLKLVYKQVESFEETAKATLYTRLAYSISVEVDELEAIVDEIVSKSGKNEDDDNNQEEDENGDSNEAEEDEDADEDDDADDDEAEEDEDGDEDDDADENEAEEDEDGDDDEDGDEDDDADENEAEEDEDGDDDEDGDEEEDEVGLSVENLKRRIQSFTHRLKMEVQSCSDGLYNFIPDEEDDVDGAAISSRVIGVSDVYQQLKDKVMGDRQFISLDGMPGIGKTTLANKLIHDPTIEQHFDHCVWVHMGKNYRVEDIPRRILEEMDPNNLQTFPEGDEEAVHEYLKASLKSKRYLIVLDDVWDRFAMYLLSHTYRYEWKVLNHPFLHPESASRILLTSRLQQLSETRGSLTIYERIVTMRLLNKEESWDLLYDKVFCKGSSCSHQFDKVGKKISENCDGLPLTILTVARLLSQEETSTLEYWNEVAAKKNHQLFVDAYDEILKVLLPSYTYLPPLLQTCFLFIGLFPRNHEIPRTKLIYLWMADGFFELNISINSDSDAVQCLEELVSNNIVMVYKKSNFTFSHSVKTCGLHTSLWHMSRKIATQTKFAFILSSPDDCFGADIEGCHRLSFNNNVLFAMKSVNKSVEDNYALVARSLLCFGPYHQYQVPLCFRLKLLRELDAIAIRFYEFPMKVLQLVLLRYLALTSNGMIPPSISQLSSLQFLIIDRHQNIKSCRDQSYLPTEIWSLQDLKHLQVMGSDLPDPRGASLFHLSTLLDVSARSCTEVVLKGLPGLRELKIRIELTPADSRPPSWFTHISYLQKLRFLKCIVVNSMAVPPIVPLSSFPPLNLKTLSLSGLGYPWKELRKIASIPTLCVLKLKNYAFQGPEWEVEETGFIEIESLEIEDTDLVDWQFGVGAFESLESLVIKSCYKLEKIRGDFIVNLKKVELFDCNPSCVEEMKKAVKKEAVLCVLDVHSSWDDHQKLKTYTREMIRSSL